MSATEETVEVDAGGVARRASLSTADWILVLALIAVSLPGWQAMAGVWNVTDHYSHGFAIPLMALWAASAKRGALRREAAVRDPRGLPVLLGVLAIYGLGLASGLVWLTGLGVVGLIGGGILYLRGASWLRELAFPVVYLVFMIPLPDAWLTPIIVRLQLFVSTLGTALLRLLGEPVLRFGNVLQLPGGEQLFVAEACSGITSLITLVPIGVFVAYFMETGWWRRSLLVATVVPVALAANLFRVVVTVFAAERVGAQAATESSLHDWLGVTTYVLACLVLVGTARLMRRRSPRAQTT